MIELRNLYKQYETGDVITKVLHDISLTIPKGQLVAIIGKSGAGKSTLLYQMSLLDNPTAGTIFLNGTDTTTISDTHRVAMRLSQLGYIFQDYSLVPELTAQENVLLPLLMMGVNKSDALNRSRRMLETVGLSHRLNHLPTQLSGGEKQRAGIARAIVNNPAILFADEPTASLDSENSQEVINLLKQLHADGQTIVMVTHEMEYAHQCERILEIKDGSIVSDTAPSRRSL